MKKNYFFTVSLLGSLLFSQVGINTDSPDSSAALDVQSIDKTGRNKTGVLIPRVELESTTDVTNNPARGLLVYNTKTQNDVLRDNFYYFDGTKWSPFLSRNETIIVPVLAAAFKLEKDMEVASKTKMPIVFDTEVSGKNSNLISYDKNTGIFTVQEEGVYYITFQVGILGARNVMENVIGIIAAAEGSQFGKTYKKEDWLGRATFVDNKNRKFAIYVTYIHFKKGEKIQAAAYVDAKNDTKPDGTAPLTSDVIEAGAQIQGIQSGSTGSGNVTNISIVKY